MPTFNSLHILSKCFKLCKEVKLEFAKVAMKPVGPPVCVVIFHLSTLALHLNLDVKQDYICPQQVVDELGKGGSRQFCQF